MLLLNWQKTTIKLAQLESFLMKAADILQAYVKTKNELRFNNVEFSHVQENLDKSLDKLKKSFSLI